MQIWFHSAEIFWPSYELKQIPLQSDPRRSSCCEEKHAIHPTASQFKQQRRKNQNNSTRSCFFLLSSFTDKAAGLLLWSWLPRRHYMQDSDIVQRIQPQLLHMAWTASVKQRLLYHVCTCCTTTLSLSLVASQLSSSSCCGRSTCVTPWGRCRRRSTSLATWPSLFTTSLCCRRFSMSSGNRL